MTKRELSIAAGRWMLEEGATVTIAVARAAAVAAVKHALHYTGIVPSMELVISGIKTRELELSTSKKMSNNLFVKGNADKRNYTLDVKTAFLHGDLDEHIYMVQPTGYVVSEKSDHGIEILENPPLPSISPWVETASAESLSCSHFKVVVFSDSQSAIHLSKNHVYHDRTKHVDVKYHYAKEMIANRTVGIQKVSTANNPTDMGTKVEFVIFL
ncbi:uncharacterized protein LOC127809258 [Diospyros lotus]|uniref:uncharacterized protein LOC127809258 n=1 Tax=Diospyros lotus TaxID=55363 RepID=UPI002254B9FC|nr:uncharacterized protein LOC127809258 [Diospyros lotus]